MPCLLYTSKATNTCTLADIQKYLASLDVTLSLQAISTYSRKLLASLCLLYTSLLWPREVNRFCSTLEQAV